MTRHRVHRIIFLLLALISLIVGSLYKSLLTTDIISQIPGRISVKYISELTSWSIALLPYQHILHPETGQDAISLNTLRHESLKFRGNGVKLLREEIFQYFSKFGNMITYAAFGSRDRASDFYSKIKTLKNMQPNTRLFSAEDEVLNYLSSCRNKAYIGNSQEVMNILKYNNNRLKLGLGKDKFFLSLVSWRIPKHAGEFLNRKFSSMISSGIYHMWEVIFYAKTRSELDISETQTIERKQSLRTQLGAFFFLFLICIGFCIFVYFLEFITGNTIVFNLYHLN